MRSQGIVFKQVRVQAVPRSSCHTRMYGTACYPEIQHPAGVADAVPFGYNWTHPSEPLAHPWVYYTASELGAQPAGISSAAVSSFRNFEAGGFIAVAIPFLSTKWLPEQRGTYEQVTDFRLHALRRTSMPPPTLDGVYFCIRLSWNGDHLHQLCDPNSPDSPQRTTGVIRLAFEEFLNDLKRCGLSQADCQVEAAAMARHLVASRGISWHLVAALASASFA